MKNINKEFDLHDPFCWLFLPQFNYRYKTYCNAKKLVVSKVFLVKKYICHKSTCQNMKLNLLWTFGQLLSVFVGLIWISNIWIHRKSIWLYMYINFRFPTLFAHGWRWNWLKTLSALLWFISCHIQTFCFFFSSANSTENIFVV